MMNVVFGNPAGFFALFAIPVILAVHLLQRESRRVRTSTLFLLERINPESAQGRRVERIRNSIPLWLQLLAALLVTWLLVQPRWLREDTSQTVVVVLDSSVSMDAFRARAEAALRSRLPAILRTAARTELILLESDPARATLYTGEKADDLFAALAAWQPGLGTHDPMPALRVAGSLSGRDGSIIFVTDRKAEVGGLADVIAVGEPFDNVGLVGLEMQGNKWTALVRNHGATPQSRTWHFEANQFRSAERSLALKPGEIVALHGEIPDGAVRGELLLSEDGFRVDDRLPIVTGKPKDLTLSVADGNAFFERFAGSVSNVTRDGDPDIALLSVSPDEGVSADAAAVVAVGPATENGEYLRGPIVAGGDPLTENLSWQGLIVRDGPRMPAREDDEVLLWQGAQPLVFLRDGKALIVNFDIAESNADRLPAFVVMLNRFVESVRAGKSAYERLNVELNQFHPMGPMNKLRVEGGSSLAGGVRAPDRPGFLSAASAGGEMQLEAAAHFADVREADFRAAATLDETEARVREAMKRNYRAEFWTPVWTLLLGIVCFGNWALQKRR